MRNLRSLLCATLCIAAVSGASAVRAQDPVTPTSLRAALSGAGNNDALADGIRKLFGGEENIKKGANPKTDNTPAGLTVAWAIEVPGLTADSAPQVVTDDPSLPSLKMQRVGATDIYVGTAFAPKGLAGHWSYVVGGEKRGGGQYETYPVNPEEKVQPGVPQGKVTEMPVWRSKIIAGTSRRWWVYVPAQYTPDKPAAVMVFQDGGGPKGWMPPIFDNMIARGELPPIVGIFIEPGKFDDGKANRSVEYDSLNDNYSQMLLQEILPEVKKTINLSDNPDDHAIFGVSSGGICAFTVAWNHPDVFRKVDTCVGSFTALQGGPTGVAGGNTYPAIIRKSSGQNHNIPPKPIKMFQTDGANDLDNLYGNWPLCNQQIARALDFSGYEHRFVFGNGFHGDRFGRYMMPTGLRYLWGAGK